jgi:hypothetical protein
VLLGTMIRLRNAGCKMKERVGEDSAVRPEWLGHSILLRTALTHLGGPMEV